MIYCYHTSCERGILYEENNNVGDDMYWTC